MNRPEKPLQGAIQKEKQRCQELLDVFQRLESQIGRALDLQSA